MRKVSARRLSASGGLRRRVGRRRRSAALKKVFWASSLALCLKWLSREVKEAARPQEQAAAALGSGEEGCQDCMWLRIAWQKWKVDVCHLIQSSQTNYIRSLHYLVNCTIVEFSAFLAVLYFKCDLWLGTYLPVANCIFAQNDISRNFRGCL